MAKTKFGVFSLSQFPDLAKVVESFDNDLGFFELAEQLGYDKVWIAEHLFSTYGLVTSTQVYAAAIAQRTKKIRIGMAVCAIPFNHPLRTASDFALVDILSHGRLDFGVGRAYQPHEFVGLGVPMDQSREMLAEGLDIVLKSWTQEKIAYRGKFWTIPEPVELLPKPVQKPHPPVLVGGGLPYGARRALAYGDGWMPHAKRPTYRLLDKLPEYREMEKAAGRVLPITAFGAEHDPSAWAPYRDAGIDRIVLSINSEAADAVLPQLDQWAAKLAAVR
jgi:alkanesulfonate monooxygenase SsuD/methylene tetrahydromethanopterin reductase-like flavin-dependent oxidoreductase (luciferase family)